MTHDDQNQYEWGADPYDYYSDLYYSVPDYDKSEDVAKELHKMKRGEARDLINTTIYLLDSFIDADNLLEMFDWRESDNGHAFWLEIYNEMVSKGLSTYPDSLTEIKT